MQTEIIFDNVHPNSHQVYQEKVLPTIRGRKLSVYSAIKALGGEASSYEVAQHLNCPLHTISGRFGELVKLEMINDAGKRKEHHGNNFTIWRCISHV